MTQLVALADGTVLAGDYVIRRVLGVGGFGITYLADEQALSRRVAIKEYFPADFAARDRDDARVAAPRSKACAGDYKWGLDRFVEEAQTLARFNHANIVKVHRIFRAHGTAYMVLHFEEGQSLKAWIKGLKRAPRQAEIDAVLAPLLDALEVIHKANFLHRDIAPDNIIIRSGGDPVLIDFGAARGELAAHSKTKTVSALVKPGYSPYEQYAESSRQQGPWTDIYALAATLYHAVTGKRPPDSPSRMLQDEMVPVRDAALAGYRQGFSDALQKGLALTIDQRPQSIAAWRGPLLAPDPEKPGVLARLRDKAPTRRKASEPDAASASAGPTMLPPPDVPGAKGGILDFTEALKKPAADKAQGAGPPKSAKTKVEKVSPLVVKTLVVPPAKTPVALVPARTAKAVLPAPLPVAATRRGWLSKRRQPRPQPDAPRRPLTRGLRSKIAMALAFSGALFAFHDQIPRALDPSASAITTGAIAPALTEQSTLTATAEFKAHDGAVRAVRLSGDGRLFVTLGGDGALKVWSTDGLRLQGTIALETAAVTSIAVRNNRVAVAYGDGSFSLYDLETRQRLQRFKRGETPITSIAFAGSEERVASGSGDATISLWETPATSEPVGVLNGPSNSVQAVAVDHDGRWLASGSDDRNVKIWNLQTRDGERTLRNHSGAVSAVSFSPDGAFLAAGSVDGGIRIWSMQSGRLQRVLNANGSRVSDLAFSPDGDWLATASQDGALRVRSIKRSRQAWSLGRFERPVTCVTFAPDGLSLFAGGDDGTVRQYMLPIGRVAQRN